MLLRAKSCPGCWSEIAHCRARGSYLRAKSDSESKSNRCVVSSVPTQTKVLKVPSIPAPLTRHLCSAGFDLERHGFLRSSFPVFVHLGLVAKARTWRSTQSRGLKADENE